jgi:hypothetical protein
MHGLKLSLGERAACRGEDAAGQSGRSCSPDHRQLARRQLVHQCGKVAFVASLLTSRHKFSKVLP